MEINELLRKTQTEHAGIDYSHGMSNVDTTTGVHYGVINQQEVLQAWADSSEADYGTPEETECPECGAIFWLEPRTTAEGFDGCAPQWEWGDIAACPDCDHEFDVECPDGYEPNGFVLDDGEYVASAGDDGDIFIIKSPYFTRCVFCSPCAPGAGYLMTPTPDGIKAFCFSHDWFETSKAPYPVYRVDTGEEVTP